MIEDVDIAPGWLRENNCYLIRECNMMANLMNICILYERTNGSVMLLVSIHVDDSLVSGKKV